MPDRIFDEGSKAQESLNRLLTYQDMLRKQGYFNSVTTKPVYQLPSKEREADDEVHAQEVTVAPATRNTTMSPLRIKSNNGSPRDLASMKGDVPRANSMNRSSLPPAPIRNQKQSILYLAGLQDH